MRRFLVVTVALTVVATLVMTASATASSRATRPTSVPARPTMPERAVRNGIVTEGSTWTYYDFDQFDGGLTGFCEVFTFGSSHVFTGDHGDVGHWSGNITLKFTGPSGDFASGEIYKGKYITAQQYFGGTVTLSGFPNDVGLLASGDDPFDVGDC